MAAIFPSDERVTGPRWEPHQASLSHQLMKGEACQQVRQTKRPVMCNDRRLQSKTAVTHVGNIQLFIYIYILHARMIVCVCTRIKKQKVVPHGHSFSNWICRGCDASRGLRERSSARFFLSLALAFFTTPKCSMQPLIVLLIGGTA